MEKNTDFSPEVLAIAKQIQDKIDNLVSQETRDEQNKAWQDYFKDILYRINQIIENEMAILGEAVQENFHVSKIEAEASLRTALTIKNYIEDSKQYYIHE